MAKATARGVADSVGKAKPRGSAHLERDPAPRGGAELERKDMAEAGPEVGLDAPEAYINREQAWLGFARRVLAQVERKELPLAERIKFAGIMGMLHDEFFMKRMSNLKRRIKKGSKKRAIDGSTASQMFHACRKELLDQVEILASALREDLLPELNEEGIPILDYEELEEDQKAELKEYFRLSVLPILTPLAVDAEHPFPFISNLGVNLAVWLHDEHSGRERFVRVKVPNNRPRWVPVPGTSGFVPLEQVIASNLDLVFPGAVPQTVSLFRVTRGAEGDQSPAAAEELTVEDVLTEPGSVVRQVSRELNARKFAGVVRLQVDSSLPKKKVRWLAKQLGVSGDDTYTADSFLGLSDLAHLEIQDREDLVLPRHIPVTHPRLRGLDLGDSGAIFDEIARGDILLHLPYHSFDTSVLRFLESAAEDPSVLAIKLTIYRTSKDSPTVKALVEAARRGKQVAVLVEITARFDEAPNIAWGKFLENEGVHVAYGVERLKTHVKLALVVREEEGTLRRYAHVGTGNYHSGTARIYEDIGILTCDPEICEDTAAVFNSLTGSTHYSDYRKVLVAPVAMRRSFTELIRREADNARGGLPSGINAKMNQLQDTKIIRELYRAGKAGVPIVLNVRGLCCLRPGIPGLSENIRVFGIIDRFLEHSRIYRFTNGGDPEYFIGSADWMKRNLDKRVETVMPVHDPDVKEQLEEIMQVYESDNASAWHFMPSGEYLRREPGEGEERRAAQECFIRKARDPLFDARGELP